MQRRHPVAPAPSRRLPHAAEGHSPAPAAASGRRRRRVATVAALTLVAGYCITAYLDSLLMFFFLDDFWMLRDVAAMQWRTPLDLVQLFKPTHVSFLMYRPLSQYGYFALLRALFGCDASAYHAVQLLVFTCCALLVFAIARTLTGSIRAGLAASLIYAAAPGHAETVFWMATSTMLGPALVVLLMVLAWLRIASPAWRVAVCTTLQVIGLLMGEHAVTAPIVLALVSWESPREEPWRRRALFLLPSCMIVAAYLAFKAWYVTAVLRTYFDYTPSYDPVVWLTNAGHYALGSINFIKLQRSKQPGTVSLLVGIGLVLLLVAAVWRAQRGRPGWRLLAIGVGAFLTALLPVVVLPAHFFDYYVGIAALGVGLATVAACQLVLPRRWPSVALAIAAGVVLFDIVSGQRAARTDPFFVLATGGARVAADFVAAVAAARAPGVVEVAVLSTPTTKYVFDSGHAEQVFPGMPPNVRVFQASDPPREEPGRAVVSFAPYLRPGDELPCWHRRWAWLRGVARWWSDELRTGLAMIHPEDDEEGGDDEE